MDTKMLFNWFLNHSDKIELNAGGNDGFTAFMEACYRGHKDVVKLLLNHSECKRQLGKDCIYVCLPIWTQRCRSIASGSF